MSVYKEGYYIIKEIEKRSVQIYSDAADFGAPVRKGDELWNMIKQLADWYGDPETRVLTKYELSIAIRLMDEHGSGSVDVFELTYCEATKGRCKGYDGYVSVNRLRKSVPYWLI